MKTKLGYYLSMLGMVLIIVGFGCLFIIVPVVVSEFKPMVDTYPLAPVGFALISLGISIIINVYASETILFEVTKRQS